MTAPTRLKIDVVSDVACPWCAVGLASLEQALARLEGEVAAELHFQPFELNPDLGPEGQDVGEYLSRKYGSTPAQQQANWQALRERGAAVGFTFRAEGRGRVWNTFNAHRLLHWAGEQGEGAQLRLKKALLAAYFTRGESTADVEVLAACVREAGLDEAAARDLLATDRYAQEVRAQQRFYAGHGIRAVPSVVINDRHLVQGGQPPEVFEQVLRELAAQASGESAGQAA